MKNIYVLDSVYENENNNNTYLTNEDNFIQLTEKIEIDGLYYYQFIKK